MADDDKAVFARCPAFNIECQYVAEVDRLSAENERLTAIVADRLLGSSVDHRTFKDIIAENERLRGFATNKTDELANILEAGEGI